jgi:hypothetical protein
LRKGVRIGHESLWVNVYEDRSGDEMVITLVGVQWKIAQFLEEFHDVFPNE